MKLSAAIILFALLLASPLTSKAAERFAVSGALRGDGRIALFRPDKNERETFVYRDKSGRYIGAAFDRIEHFFRCRLTGETHPIDPALIEIQDAIEDHFGAGEIRLISQYRSPTRNALMRRQGRKVAKTSLHMRGMAADIEIAGVRADQIRDFAYGLKHGGVGYYGMHTFVHLDSGRVRTWGWRAPVGTRTSATAYK